MGSNPTLSAIHAALAGSVDVRGGAAILIHQRTHRRWARQLGLDADTPLELSLSRDIVAHVPGASALVARALRVLTPCSLVESDERLR